MALSLFDQANALTKANQVNPTLNPFEEDKGVAGRVNTITSQDGPLMQLAATRARQDANKMGLRNSSMAVGAGQKAVLEAATPLATADASLYQQSRLANQQAQNAASTTNSNNAIQAGMRGTELDQGGMMFDKEMAQKNQQFDATLGLDKARLGETTRQFDTSQASNRSMFDKEMAQKAEQFGLTQTQQMALANLDVQTKLKMSEIESANRADIQSNMNISNAWGTLMTNIAQIQNNPDLEQAAKQTLIDNTMDQFNRFSTFWKKATGGTVDVSDLLMPLGGAGQPTQPVNMGPVMRKPEPVPYVTDR